MIEDKFPTASSDSAFGLALNQLGTLVAGSDNQLVKPRDGSNFKDQAKRAEEFRTIFEKTPTFSPGELIHMALDELRNLSEVERELIDRQTQNLVPLDQRTLASIAAGALLESVRMRSTFVNFLHAMYHRDKAMGSRLEAYEKRAASSQNLARIERELADLFKDELRSRVEAAKARGKAAADARHSKEGGSRDMQASIREIWATGKYTSRDLCAEEECGALGVSFSAARRALRNTDDPA